ncbi:hypothetical protein FJZ28_03090, partial [Candidatus Peregrinibacteria bacterium]|nr:hypothetical protein [Candidatus Peregrinibacteria bacterium]
MLGFGRTPASLAVRDSLRSPDALIALLERFAGNDDTYDLREEEIDRILDACAQMGIDGTEHRGFRNVQKEKHRRTGDRLNKERCAAERSEQSWRTPWEVIWDMALDARHAVGALCRGIIEDLKPSNRRPEREYQIVCYAMQLEERLALSGAGAVFAPAAEVGVLNPGGTESSAIQYERSEVSVLGDMQTAFTATSGIVAIHESWITFGGRGHIVSGALPQRQPGEVYETRIQLTFVPSGDTHLYLNNDTPAYNQETGHSLIIMPEASSRNIGVGLNYNGESVQDLRDSAAVPFGNYVITMMDDDTTHRTVIRMPNGEERTYEQPQRQWENGGKIFINAGGMTIHSIDVIKKDTATPVQSAENISAMDAVFADPEFSEKFDRILAGESRTEARTETSEQPAPMMRMAVLQDQREILAEDIDELQGQIARLDASINGETQQMNEADTLLRSANDTVKRFHDQELMQRITPSISVKTKRSDSSLYLQTTSMPAGYSIAVVENGTLASYAVPTGSKSVRFTLPKFASTGTAEVVLHDTTGATVTSLHTFSHDKRTPTRAGAGTTQTRLTELTYIPGIPKESMVTRAAYDEAVIDAAAAASMRTACAERIEEFAAEKTALTERVQALERESVGRAMMYVTSENTRDPDGRPQDAWFHVRYSSPHMQTYFELTVSQDAGAGYRGTVDHPSGAHDARIDFNMAQLSGSNGDGTVTIRMYSDASKTELLDTFEGGYNRMRRTVAGETSGPVEAFEQGVRISQVRNGMVAELPMDNVTGTIRLTAWNSMSASGTVGYASDSFSVTGTLSSLDFSDTEDTVTDVYVDLDIPEGVTVKAMLFRGGLHIDTVDLRSGDPLVYSNTAGISAILFETTENTTLALNDMLIDCADEKLFEADALSRAENIVLAQKLHTENWGKIREILWYRIFENILGSNNIYNHKGGAAGAIQNQYYLMSYAGGTYTEYTLLKPDSTNSGAALGDVRYLSDTGFHSLPQEYYTRINGAIIMHPGAPKSIGVQIASGNGVTVYQTGTATDIDLLINEQTAFHPEISVQHLVNGPTEYTGFSSGFNEIRQVSRPVIAAGEQFHAVCLVYNPSGAAGQITVEVFTGSTSSPYLAGSYTGRIDGYQRAQFVANAVSPADATGLPEIRFRVTLPDGTQYWSGGMRSAEPEAGPGEGRGAKISWLRGMMETVADQHGTDSTQFKATFDNMVRIYGSETVSTAMGLTNVAGGGGGVVTGTT